MSYAKQQATALFDWIMGMPGHSFDSAESAIEQIEFVLNSVPRPEPVNARLLDALKHAVGWARADVSCTKQDYDFYNDLIAAAEQAKPSPECCIGHQTAIRKTCQTLGMALVVQYGRL